MTRLAAVEKVLYYPTQARVIERIAAELRLCGVDGQAFSFVDPCCGEGIALARLAELLAESYNDKGGAHRSAHPKVVTCGVEIHRGRYLEAKRRLDRAHNASAFQAVGGGFDLMLLNPPYAAGDGSRQEIEFFRACAPLVRRRGGVIVFIPPRKILAEPEFVRAVRSLGGVVRVLDYPEPERAEYDQVVVIVVTGADGWRPASQLTVPLPTPSRVVGDVPKGLWSEDWFRVSAPWGEEPSGHLRVSSFDPHAWERLSVYDSAAWEKTMNLGAHAVARPLVRPRPGHQAMLLAAGCIDGAELTAGVLVKGSSEKVSSEVSRDSDKKTVTYRERIRSRVSTLDLATMKLEAWSVEDEPERTAEWFRAHGDALARAVRDVHDPEFDGDVAPWAAKVAALSPPGKLPGHDVALFLPLQVESACAIAHRWRKHKHVVLSGEMGVGKTTIATVASELHGGKLKRIVVCPPHLVAKWIRELETVTRTKGVARTAKKLSDVDAFFRSSSRYLVLSKETAKLGASWRDAFNRKTIAQVGEREELVEEIPVWPYKVTKRVRDVRRRVEVRCPRCGSDPVTYMEPGAYTDEATMRGQLKQRCKAIVSSVGARTAVVDGVPTAMPAKLAEVRTCGEPLWQAEPLNAKGTLRWPLARYASKRHGGRYVLVVDEAHQYAKADSDQSRAVAQLAAQAAKILVMTGTLYGGRASSIFHLLHKVDPDFRDRYRFEDMPRFVEHHGLFERTVKDEEETSRGGYKRGLSHARVREVPGMTPAMIPLLLPSTIFVKLKDLQVDLPPYREIVELVDADPAVFAEAKRMQMDALAEVRRNPQVLGAYLQACLGYPDAPEDGDEIVGMVRMDGGVDLLERKVIASALPIAEPPEGFAKDRRVLEIVEDAWRRGRGVCVFFAQTHRRDARGRVKALLESEGFRVVVLDDGVASDKREDWIRARQAEGFDVMLTNGRLVETGLDLLWAHTIVQYGIEYSVHVLRQSTRRSWRLGQSKPVEVYHLAYKGLLQEIALDLIAKKMRAAEMVDGDDVGGLGRTDVSGGNFLVELAQEVIAASESW